ncbi:MAG: hypothetical protein NTZ61_14095 [Proteobacteria bacterium]|nr:hypothetical protein [Pseudomonadota bacterium]
MDRITDRTETPAQASATWQRPVVEVINLACELSAYAPDDGGPLF